MKPMGFSAKPEKLGRFRGRNEDEGRVSTGHFAERSDGRNGASAGQHGAFLTVSTGYFRPPERPLTGADGIRRTGPLTRRSGC